MVNDGRITFLKGERKKTQLIPPFGIIFSIVSKLIFFRKILSPKILLTKFLRTKLTFFSKLE